MDWISIRNWPTETRERVVEKPPAAEILCELTWKSSSCTQATIDIFKRLRAEFGLNDVGIVLQSYLYRTYEDAQELVKLPARIRICKGAYNEPPEVAFPDKKDIDENYVKVMQLLLSSGIYHGIATHDPKMIDATIDFAKREGIGKEKFEFQMLYGIRRDLQRQLARDGYNMRVYVPYGKHWYPYFMRRLAERPANIWFVLKNMREGLKVDMSEWFWVLWCILGAILIVAEIFTTGFVLLWFGIGALGGRVCRLYRDR